MKFNYLSFGKSVLAFFTVVSLISSCGNSKDPITNGEDLQESDNDTVKNTLLNVGGKLFSIPSPVETSILIQKTGVAYNKDFVSSHKSEEYKGMFYQAINLGVYGADLGYVTMYNQSGDQIKYLAQARKLSDMLGISNAFDTKTMERINNNISKKDSLLVLVGVAYRSSDAFLKSNQRSDVSGLILTGGWIESLNFAAQTLLTNPNSELKQRIAFQKQSLKSIIELLGQFKDEKVPELKEKLMDLQKVYDGVKLTYVYEKPETDAMNKSTTFNSKTEVTISDEQLRQVAEKIKVIREWIIAGDKI